MPRARVIAEYPGKPARSIRMGDDYAARVGALLVAEASEFGIVGEPCVVLATDGTEGAERRQAVLDSLHDAGCAVRKLTLPANIVTGMDCVLEMTQAFSRMDAESTVVVALGGEALCRGVCFAAAHAAVPLSVAVVPVGLAAAVACTAPFAATVGSGAQCLTALVHPAMGIVDLDFVAAGDAAERQLGLALLLRYALLARDDALLFLLEEHPTLVDCQDQDLLLQALAQALVAFIDWQAGLAEAAVADPRQCAALRRADSFGISFAQRLAGTIAAAPTAGQMAALLLEGMLFELRLGVAHGATPRELLDAVQAIAAAIETEACPVPSSAAAAQQAFAGWGATRCVPQDVGSFVDLCVSDETIAQHLGLWLSR